VEWARVEVSQDIYTTHVWPSKKPHTVEQRAEHLAASLANKIFSSVCSKLLGF
jgi:hypothetical protein